MFSSIAKTCALALVLSFIALPAQAQDAEDYALRLVAEDTEIDEFSLVDVDVVIDFIDGVELQGFQWGICDDEHLDLNDDGDIVKGTGLVDLSFTFESVSLADTEDGWTVGALFNVITGDTLEPDDDVQMYVCTYEAGPAPTDGTECFNSVVEFCDTLGDPAVPTQVVSENIELVPDQTSAFIDVCGELPPTLGLAAPELVELTETDVAVSFTLDNPEPAEGDDAVEVYAFSFGVSHDDSLVSVASISEGAALSDFNDTDGPSYFASVIDPDGVPGFTVACVMSFGPTDIEFLGTGVGQEIAVVTYDAVIGAPEDSVSDLEFVDDLGSPAVLTRFSIQGAESVVPDKANGSIIITIPEIPIFVRGDVNDDTTIDISDAFYLARALFDNGPGLTCEDAGDADNNESLGIADVQDILAYLFTNGADLPAPFDSCGPGDETEDDGLGCATSQVEFCN